GSLADSVQFRPLIRTRFVQSHSDRPVPLCLHVPWPSFASRRSLPSRKILAGLASYFSLLGFLAIREKS
ncbi:MAG: hypothetical protein ACRD88_00585, partial [Terriglobia bacterium]